MSPCSTNFNRMASPSRRLSRWRLLSRLHSIDIKLHSLTVPLTRATNLWSGPPPPTNNRPAKFLILDGTSQAKFRSWRSKSWNWRKPTPGTKTSTRRPSKLGWTKSKSWSNKLSSSIWKVTRRHPTKSTILHNSGWKTKDCKIWTESWSESCRSSRPTWRWVKIKTSNWLKRSNS